MLMDYETLNLLFRCGKEFSHKTIKSRDLGDTEGMVCSYIFSNGGCSQDEAAASLKADKTTVAKAVSALEKKGLLRRERDQNDKRRNKLYITPAGKTKIAGLAEMHNKWLSSVMAVLSKEEQRQFEDFCRRILCEAERLTK